MQYLSFRHSQLYIAEGESCEAWSGFAALEYLDVSWFQNFEFKNISTIG